MLIKVISITFDSAYGGFNDEIIRDFLKDKELISARDYLFVKNDVPYLTFVLRYFPHRAEIEQQVQTNNKKKEAWRESLSEADMGLFNLLRDWRSKRSKRRHASIYPVYESKFGRHCKKKTSISFGANAN